MIRILALLAFLTPVTALAGATEWIPFDLENGRILFDAEIDGRSARAVFDSGSAVNAIDEQFLKSHSREFKAGRLLEIEEITGREKKRTLDDVPVRVFGSNLSLSQLFPGNLGTADILLGLGFFNNFTVQIDYPNLRMRLVDRDSIDLKKLANVRLKHDTNDLPMVQVTMNGKESVWLVLDTGSPGGVFMKRDFADARGWLDAYPSVAGSSTSITGQTAPIETFNLPSLTIGPVKLESVPVSVPVNEGEMFLGNRDEASAQGGHSRLRQRGADGLLGYDVLKHFLVTMDYRGKKMHIAISQPAADSSLTSSE